MDVVDLDWPKCRRHDWAWRKVDDSAILEMFCIRCGRPKDEARSRRGKNARDYGNRAELAVARTYGGTKIGHAGGPVDVEGTDWDTQVKTHRRKPPLEWVKAFGAMTNPERMPRLLLRFVQVGSAPDDYFVVRGADWLAWHGKDSAE